MADGSDIDQLLYSNGKNSAKVHQRRDNKRREVDEDDSSSSSGGSDPVASKYSNDRRREKDQAPRRKQSSSNKAAVNDDDEEDDDGDERSRRYKATKHSSSRGGKQSRRDDDDDDDDASEDDASRQPRDAGKKSSSSKHAGSRSRGGDDDEVDDVSTKNRHRRRGSNDAEPISKYAESKSSRKRGDDDDKYSSRSKDKKLVAKIGGDEDADDMDVDDDGDADADRYSSRRRKDDDAAAAVNSKLSTNNRDDYRSKEKYDTLVKDDDDFDRRSNATSSRDRQAAAANDDRMSRSSKVPVVDDADERRSHKSHRSARPPVKVEVEDELMDEKPPRAVLSPREYDERGRIVPLHRIAASVAGGGVAKSVMVGGGRAAREVSPGGSAVTAPPALAPVGPPGAADAKLPFRNDQIAAPPSAKEALATVREQQKRVYMREREEYRGDNRTPERWRREEEEERRQRERDRDRGGRGRGGGRDYDADDNDGGGSRRQNRRSRSRSNDNNNNRRHRDSKSPSPSHRRGGGGGGGDDIGVQGGHRSVKGSSSANSPKARNKAERTPSPLLNEEERDQRTVFVMQLSQRVTAWDLEEFFSAVGKIRDVRLIVDGRTKRSKGIAYIEYREMESVPLAIGLNGQKLRGVPLKVQASHAERNRAAEAAAALMAATNGSAFPPPPITLSAATAAAIAEAHGPPSLSTLPIGSGRPYIPRHLRKQQALEVAAKAALATKDGGERPMRIYVGSLHFSITEDDLRAIFEPFGGLVSVALVRDAPTGRSRGYAFLTFRRQEDAQVAIEQMNGFDLAGRQIKVSHVTEKGGPEFGGGDPSERLEQEDSRGGMGLSGSNRLALMAKLAEGTGLELPEHLKASLDQSKQSQELKIAAQLQAQQQRLIAAQEAKFAAQMAAQTQPNDVPEYATQCILLSHMFDPSQESGTEWAEEIKDDVISECQKHGGCVHAYVDRDSKDGNVYAKCPSVSMAAATVKSMNGRHYGGRIIQANYVPVAHYNQLFQGSVRATIRLQPRGAAAAAAATSS